MSIIDFYNSDQIISHVISLAKSAYIRVTLHAHQEMVEEDIELDDVLSFDSGKACRKLSGA